MSEQRVQSVVSSLWTLGLALSVLAAAAPFLGPWWIAALGAAAGVGLTAFLALRARGAANDIAQENHDREQALARAEEDAADLRAALTALPIPTAVCAPGGAVLAASHSLDRTLGTTVAEGASLESVVGPEAARASTAGDPTPTELHAASGAVPATATSAAAPGGRRVVQFVPPLGGGDDKDYKELEKSFRSTSRTINDLAQRMASASELMSAYADDQAHGAKKQKDQTVAVTESIERMMNAVMEIASNASGTSEAADEARDVAREGVGQVHQAVEGVGMLSRSAKELADVLADLDNQAAEIGRIIGVITDIADQTNLLALNAAIEAARAGDAGRGFAVVADEVRKLAEKTMTATQEVKQSITTIQRSSKDAMASMDRTGKQVDESTELSNSAGQALEKVMEHIEGMVGRVQQIAHAAEEQSSAAEAISASVEDIAEIARDADEGATQQAYATRDIATLSSELLKVSRGIAGSEEDGPGHKIAKSEGQMKGVLPKLMEDYLKTLGADVHEAVMEEIGNPVFMPSESYPDGVLRQMAELAGAATGKKPKQILFELGTETIKGFHKLYKRYFKTKDLKEFLLSLNDIHAEVVRNMPGVKPPAFTYEDKGDVLFMNYKSPRALFDYFEGILHGAAAFMGQKADIKVKPLNKDTARAEIRFR